MLGLNSGVKVGRAKATSIKHGMYTDSLAAHSAVGDSVHMFRRRRKEEARATEPQHSGSGHLSDKLKDLVMSERLWKLCSPLVK